MLIMHRIREDRIADAPKVEVGNEIVERHWNAEYATVQSTYFVNVLRGFANPVVTRDTTVGTERVLFTND